MEPNVLCKAALSTESLRLCAPGNIQVPAPAFPTFLLPWKSNPFLSPISSLHQCLCRSTMETLTTPCPLLMCLGVVCVYAHTGMGTCVHMRTEARGQHQDDSIVLLSYSLRQGLSIEPRAHQ